LIWFAGRTFVFSSAETRPSSRFSVVQAGQLFFYPFPYTIQRGDYEVQHHQCPSIVITELKMPAAVVG
jgi:hypothetical protein